MQMTRTRDKPPASRATLLVSDCTNTAHSITFVIAGKELEKALTIIQKCGNYREITVIWRRRTPPIEALLKEQKVYDNEKLTKDVLDYVFKK